MLEVQDITFSYQKNGNQILEHVNLSVGPEERLGILAPSGYGKTTLLKIISGYISPDAGQNPCRRRAASTERLLSGTDDLSASGTGSQSTTSHARGAKRRRWHLKRADRRTWDRRRLEKPFSAGTFRGRTSEILYCKSIGEGNKISALR